jgi:hypothetical protein
MSLFRNIYATSLIEEVNLTGQYRGKTAKVFEVLGRRTSFVNTTALHDVTDITPASVLFPTVTSAEALEVVSTSASDTNTAGTGARTVCVTYIDASNNLVSANVNLNGTTAVPAGFTANEIISMENIVVGNNTVSVGDVILRKVTGAVQLEIIKAGSNRSLSAKFMIPAGYTGYVFAGTFAAISQTMDFRMRATVKTFDRSLLANYIFQHTFFLASGQNSSELAFPFMRYPALSRIKTSVIAGATGGNPRADCTFTVVIIQD